MNAQGKEISGYGWIWILEIVGGMVSNAMNQLLFVSRLDRTYAMTAQISKNHIRTNFVKKFFSAGIILHRTNTRQFHQTSLHFVLEHL